MWFELRCVSVYSGQGEYSNPLRRVSSFSASWSVLSSRLFKEIDLQWSVDYVSCSATFFIVTVMSFLGTIVKGYLFLIRVRAVYSNSTTMTICVGCCWLAAVGTRLAVSIMVQGAPIGQTGYCSISGTRWSTSFPVVGLWSNLVYDTFVFVVIYIRLTMYSEQTSQSLLSPIIFGSSRHHQLPSFTRHLLQDGQVYYFTTVGLGLLAGIMALLPVSPVLKSAFCPPALAIETVMTCKVFRSMILRSLYDERELDFTAQPNTSRTFVIELDTRISTEIMYNDSSTLN